jgi:four helix bundle protein
MVFKKLEEIEVWQRGCRLAVDIYKLTRTPEFNNDWGLRDQIRRASVAIPSNIAEGYGRISDAEFNRFLVIARGSSMELKTQLHIAHAICYIEKVMAEKLTGECDQIASMLTSLSKYLKKSTKYV